MAFFRGLTNAFILSVLCAIQEAGAALRGDVVSRDVVKRRFLSEFEALLGHGTSHARLECMEETIRATFVAMPKTSDGGVTQDTARYVLSRYFNRRHGWRINGLDKKSSEGGEGGSSLEMLKSKMPSVVFGLLEQQLAGRSIGLREIVALAATVEDLVYGESVDLMNTASTLLADMGEIVTTEGFLVLFTQPSGRDKIQDVHQLTRRISSLSRGTPGWNDLALWAQDVRLAVAEAEEAKANPFLPAVEPGGGRHLALVAEAVTEGFGRNQDLECRAIKNKLLDLSDRSDGRVLLSKFYSAYMDHTSKYFVESKDYLRHHGLLEEVDRWRPTVLVANYVNSAANCIAASGFMSTCCINECEAILSSVEEQVAGPTASPQRIADVVSALSSDTVAAPRRLPVDLVGRLGEIADLNGGEVPLHGRLFAEWMHYAYPNECPRPHKVNESKTVSFSPTANATEMMDVIDYDRYADFASTLEGTEAESGTVEQRREWLSGDQEELFVPGVAEARAKDSGMYLLVAIAKWSRLVAMVAVVLGSLYVVAGKLRSLRGVQGLPEFTSKSREKTHFF